MNFRNFLFSIMTTIILTAFASAGEPQSSKPPLNLIPMYGYPGIEKSAELKKADEEFIRTIPSEFGTRENASKIVAGEAWKYFKNGDVENAMRRFNQSWLLNPNYYEPYWGFCALLLAQDKAAEAVAYCEKALSLIDEVDKKPRLLSDAGRAYASQGSSTIDKNKSEKFFEKANSLFAEAIKLDPQYGNAYRTWALSLYLEGNYKKAWDMVKIFRGLGDGELSPSFINALSEKMPEPN